MNHEKPSKTKKHNFEVVSWFHVQWMGRMPDEQEEDRQTRQREREREKESKQVSKQARESWQKNSVDGPCSVRLSVWEPGAVSA